MDTKQKAFAWLTLISTFGLAFFNFVLYCAGPEGYQYVDNWFLVCFIIVGAIFVSCAPFKWIKLTDETFPFMTAKLWRPGFVMLLGLFCFPQVQEGASWYWGFWATIIVGAFSIFVIVVGLIEFIMDMIEPCKRLKQNGLERWDQSTQRPSQTQRPQNPVPQQPSSSLGNKQVNDSQIKQSPAQKKDEDSGVFVIRSGGSEVTVKQSNISPKVKELSIHDD